jgi:cation diffusion facilitator family transporter
MNSSLPTRLHRIALASIFVGLAVLALKLLAWWVTGSIALLSDGLESLVNVATAIATLLALRYAARPVDRNHPYGHHKAELLSAALEGILIVVAAIFILHAAILGLRNPPQLVAGPLGLAINIAASLLNGLWCFVLIRQGRRLGSPALAADGHHLLSDVVSSLGVVAGTTAALATGWAILDPATAFLVALHVLATGLKVLWSAARELMDEAPPPDIFARLQQSLARNALGATEIHDLRARKAGRMIFAEFHLVVPAGMTVAAAHAICDRIEDQVARDLPDCHLSIHLEPEDIAALSAVPSLARLAV